MVVAKQGKDDYFTNSIIISKNMYSEFEQKYINSIVDIIELGEDNYLINYKDPQMELKTFSDSGSRACKARRQRISTNVNISITRFISAYGRIHMSQFKFNNILPNLYYSDSAFFDGPALARPDSMVDSTILGKIKLEGIYDQALLLAPKYYALKNNIEEIIKIKGLTK